MAGRLSKHVDRIPPGLTDGGFDAVIVGSGYGGGVAASRLARTGLRVCVLERGPERLPGEFPDRLSRAASELQITAAGKHIGKPSALFDLRLGKDIHVLQGCGLGGTSLINANVCLKPDTRVFDDPVWPQALRSDGFLSEGFARARRMLQPRTAPPEPVQAKVEALEVAARHLGTTLKRPPLHISFEEAPNAAGVVQPACTFCGDCFSGCNVGAKTTTRNTYLADATVHGAQIFTGANVRTIAPAKDGGWEIIFRTIADDREHGQTRKIRAKTVILAAGTLGSNEILLRSSRDGLPVSEQLGHGVTSNGDILATAYNNDRAINGVGVGHPFRADVPPVGPAVAGLIDLRGTEHLEDGVAIVEAALPGVLAPILAAMLVPGSKLFGDEKETAFSDQLDAWGRALESLVGGAYRGAVHNTQNFLAIGHDEASGRLVLDDDRASLVWPGAADQPAYERIDALLARAAAATGGTHVPSPLRHPMMGHALTTVHPLGGCRMGESAETGVVNHACEVFTGGDTGTGTDVHAGLYVADGSVIPRSVGIHPLMTITAVAERAMLLFARNRGYDRDKSTQRASPTASTAAEA